MRNSVKVRDLGYERAMRETRELDRLTVTVGVQADEGADDDGVRNVDKAFWNEYGTRRIPERSFMRSAFDENETELTATIQRLWSGALAGKLTAERAARLLGQMHEDHVKRKVRTGPFDPNAQSTVDAKGSSRPLIDTGQMVNSIRYNVVS